jgi:hypothetical protein
MPSMGCIIFSSVACLAVSYFSTLSHKPLRCTEKEIEHITFVLISPTDLSETFLILRRIQRVGVINVHTSSCTIRVILNRF